MKTAAQTVILLISVCSTLEIFLEPQDAYVFEMDVAQFQCYDNSTDAAPLFIINGKTLYRTDLPDRYYFDGQHLNYYNVEHEDDNTTYQCGYANTGIISRNATLEVYSGNATELTSVTLEGENLCFGESSDPRFPIQSILVNITVFYRDNDAMNFSDIRINTSSSDCYNFGEDLDSSTCEVFQVTVEAFLSQALPRHRQSYFTHVNESLERCCKERISECCITDISIIVTPIPTPIPTPTERMNSVTIITVSVIAVIIIIVAVIAVLVVVLYRIKKRNRNSHFIT